MNAVNYRWILTALILLTGLVSTPSLWAAPARTQTNLSATSLAEFEKAKAYFNQGNYTAAVKYFKKVEAAGMESPSLYYNMASSYYMLGDYDQSSRYFYKVRSYAELRDLAEFNLGLIALTQKDYIAAEKWYTAVAAESGDKKLVFLAQEKLEFIRMQKKPEWITEKWSAYVSGTFGYDDNVNFAPLGITAERGDSFSEVSAGADYLFTGDRNDGWAGEVSFYNINYLNEDIYDESEYGAAIKKYLQLNRNWQTNYSLDILKINYDSKDYQTITRFTAESRHRLTDDQRLLLRYSYEDINSDNSLYDYLQGWRQKLHADYSMYHKQGRSRLFYELELNDRNDLSLSTGDFSYSPTRHLFRGQHTRILSRQWELTGELSYQASDYPATATQDRSDDRIKAAAYVDYRFTRDVRLRAKVAYTDNRSTEDIYEYKQTVYTLGLNAYF